MFNPMAGIGSMLSGGTDTPTYESLQKRRQIADLLAQQSLTSQHAGWGGGIEQIGKALLSKYLDHKIGPQEAAERQRAIDEVQGIQSRLGPQGIGAADYEALSGVSENPYAPKGVSGIAQMLMRRQVTPDESIGNLLAVSSRDMPPTKPTEDEGPLTVPGEYPPEEDPWQQSEAWRQMITAGSPQIDAPSPAGGGVRVAQADTGTMSDARGMKLTEGQSKDLNFWNRMDATTSEIDKHLDDLTSASERMKDSVPLIGNMMVSDEYQVGRRAANEWITALLRKDTGAAVTAEEWELYGPIYMPQPGDGPAVLKAKTEARARAAEGMKIGLGTAEVLANELLAQRQQQSPPAAVAGDDWRSQDPETWTDEQLQEFLK